MKKAVYFAAGSPQEAAEDLRRLGLTGPQTTLRVVIPAESAGLLGELASLRPEQILAFRTFSILSLGFRLWLFLGVSNRREIVFLKSPGRCRSLKLLALTLPGTLILSDGKNETVSCSHWKLLHSTVAQAIAAEGPICVIATAAPDSLRKITANLRERFPSAGIVGVVADSSGDGSADWFDSCIRAHRPLAGAYFRLLPRCLGKGRFKKIILPFTDDGHAALKWLAWMLPFWRLEAYNENLDSFSARSMVSLNRHYWWRMRQRRLLRRQRREIRLAEREARHRALPVGVVGSASAYYLKTIVPVVRANFPQAQIHGLLPMTLESAARSLFDSATILKPGLGTLGQIWKCSRMKVQCWIVPCTDEPYAAMKIAAFVFPFGPRRIYNELADGFPARQLGTFYRHLAWRSRDHMSFQILAGTAGGNWLFRAAHLAVYSLRLLMGGVALLRVRMRSLAGRRFGSNRNLKAWSGKRQTVDLIYLDSMGGDDRPEPPAAGTGAARIRIALTVERTAQLGNLVSEINAAIRNSDAQFVCLLDSRCQMLNDDWLDRLLGAFGERTAQVGPELIGLSSGSVIRGGLIFGSGFGLGLGSGLGPGSGPSQGEHEGTRAPQWNSDNAVCWIGRPDRLSVEAIPWTCMVIRRSAFLKAGGFGAELSRDPVLVDLEFCRRLAALGWNSICDQNVTATFPLAADCCDLEPAGALRAPREPEDRL